jgi:pimeloyl-ACP methyl ester carboxylesterase
MRFASVTSKLKTGRSIIAFALISCSLLASEAKFEKHEGDIEGAKYSILFPAENWNGKLVMIAHGYVPEGNPLVAALDEADPHFDSFLESGWMVARTSYRRNGVIIADAITDLELLYDHISKAFGKPELAILHGGSMGGLIVTLIAEQDQDRFDAALAVGAALHMIDSEKNLEFSYSPNIPLLFLTNRSELDGPKNYFRWGKRKGSNTRHFGESTAMVMSM